MNKLLFLATLTLLSPLATANDITPKYGHYEGTATDFHHVVHRKISFELEHDRVRDRLVHLRIEGADLHNGSKFFASMHHLRFEFHRTENLGLTMFAGHGEWEADKKAAGDFREHDRLTPSSNTYYTWHAHWVRD